MTLEPRTWCVVSSQGIEEENLTRVEAKNKCKSSPEYTAMLLEDAEEVFEDS